MKRQGFTLIELLISMAVLAIVGGLGFVAIQASASSANVAEAKAIVQSNLRDVMAGMTQELELAAKEGDPTLIPPLEPVEVIHNPGVNSPIEVAFQIPLDGTGLHWSHRIRFRYITEDLNKNGRLDEDEQDTDEDGVLTRRIIRLEDVNGDGDTNDPGERLIVASSNDLSDVQFVLTKDVLTITLTSDKVIGNPKRGHTTTATHTNRVYPLN